MILDLINEMPSYLTVARPQYTTAEQEDILLRSQRHLTVTAGFFFCASDISSEFQNVTDANLTRSVRHPVLNAIRFAFMTSRPLRPLYYAGLFAEIKPRTLHLNTLRMIPAVWLPSNRQKIVNKYHNDGRGGGILIRR
jgi:hypothetical protein